MGLKEGNRREPNIFGIFPGCFWIGPMSPNPSPYRTQRPLFPLGDSVWRNAFLLCWEGTLAQSWTDCRGGQTCAKHSLAPRDVFATRLVRSLRKSHSQIKNCMDVLMADTHFQLHPPCHPPSLHWWFSYGLLWAVHPYIQTWKTKEKHLNNIAKGKGDPRVECFYQNNFLDTITNSIFKIQPKPTNQTSASKFWPNFSFKHQLLPAVNNYHQLALRCFPKGGSIIWNHP